LTCKYPKNWLIVEYKMSEEKDLRAPKFDGTKEGWMYWRKVFLSVLTQKGMDELVDAVYDDSAEIPKAQDDCKETVGTGDQATTEVNQSKLKLKKQNAKAFSMLLGSMNLSKTSGKIAFNLVDKYQDQRSSRTNLLSKQEMAETAPGTKYFKSTKA
jgi:hypothetical protein